MTKSHLIGTFLTTALLGISVSAYADGHGHDHDKASNQEPISLIIKFDITGEPSQVNPGAFVIGGPGYAPITTASGVVLAKKIPGRQVAELTGAEIQFMGQLSDPVVDFTCLPGSCMITFDDGSVLVSDADNLPLNGRLANVYGPIDNANFTADTTPIRILGCGGLKGIDGPMAGMVGSICFNGVFNVPDFQTNFALTGGSNCTITMHTPIVPVP